MRLAKLATDGGLNKSSCNLEESSLNGIAEAFLRFSPRLTVRATIDGGLIFIDVAGTSRLFSGEAGLLQEVLRMTSELGFTDYSAAISDTPSGAQAFTAAPPSFICPPGEERENLQTLSLSLLTCLEGLEAWPAGQVRAVKDMARFFTEAGLNSFGELERFSIDSLRERWGEAGELIWKRLRARDCPPVSPFFAAEPLVEYGYLDFPISLSPLLMAAMRAPLERLFARLQGRKLRAEKASIELRCEHSDAVVRHVLAPCSPTNKLDLFLTLLERRLDEGQPEMQDNPIRSFEISIAPRADVDHQLDFFEPRETDVERLENLMSLLKQSSVRAGFLRPVASLIPEKAWTKLDAGIQTKAQTKTSLDFEFGANVTALEPGRSYRLDPLSDPAHSIRAMPIYGADVAEAPRPTRMLEKPARLSRRELSALKLLSGSPIERLQTEWWAEEPKREINRDYYFAVSAEGQCLWVFQDRGEEAERWFVHGYFD